MTSRLRSDAGSLTLWLLGWAVALLFLGGLSLDLWRIFAERQALAGLVDAAAAAGASMIEERMFRDGGQIRLDPRRAAEAIDAVLAGAQLRARVVAWERRADGGTMTVTGGVDVPLTLLRVLLPRAGPVRVSVTSTVEARPSG